MMSAQTRATLRLALLLCLSSSSFCARADLYSASVAYKKKDYADAFREFRELAELGQPRAQFNLAVMYANGEGTTVSYTSAHAWASLARANGDPNADALVVKLEPLLTPTSLQISSQIQAQFGPASLNSRLMPRFLQGREYADRDPVRRSKPYIPEYPREARMQGIQGEVYVEFLVAADGRARLPRILYAVPTGVFDGAVRDSVLRSSFLPAPINGTPIASTISTFYNFKLSNVTIDNYEGLESRAKSTLAKAEAGDASAQLIYAMMISGLPQLHQTYEKALPWFLKAAQAGSPYAQYQIGTGLLQGRGCQCDTGKGDIWLEKAAQADQPDAQVTLAEHLLRDHPRPDSVSGALIWLQRAAKSGNSSAKLYLAALLATSPQPGVRDPARSLELIDGIVKELSGDPSVWDVRAAANAARGDFKAALKDQTRAVQEATALGWDLTPLQNRQDLYASSQAWSGDLLAY
ncbi:MAG: TonB family protein [Steroidobacteraceae bacterium]